MKKMKILIEIQYIIEAKLEALGHSDVQVSISIDSNKKCPEIALCFDDDKYIIVYRENSNNMILSSEFEVQLNGLVHDLFYEIITTGIENIVKGYISSKS